MKDCLPLYSYVIERDRVEENGVLICLFRGAEMLEGRGAGTSW